MITMMVIFGNEQELIHEEEENKTLRFHVC